TPSRIIQVQRLPDHALGRVECDEQRLVVVAETDDVRRIEGIVTRSNLFHLLAATESQGPLSLFGPSHVVVERRRDTSLGIQGPIGPRCLATGNEAHARTVA